MCTLILCYISIQMFSRTDSVQAYNAFQYKAQVRKHEPAFTYKQQYTESPVRTAKESLKITFITL